MISQEHAEKMLAMLKEIVRDGLCECEIYDCEHCSHQLPALIAEIEEREGRVAPYRPQELPWSPEIEGAPKYPDFAEDRRNAGISWPEPPIPEDMKTPG
jgi:hypothetical protein